MKINKLSICTMLSLAMASVFAAEGDIKFDIQRIQVEGNSLLPVERVEQLVAPFVGQAKVYGDVQRALEALEDEYRLRGYGTVQVFVPEQELTGGVVRLQVTEATIGKINITGAKHHDEDNIRASLPLLRQGQAPNMRQLSENIQLANENPSKQVELTLGVSEEEGKVDAKVAITDEDPQKITLTLDNTGTKGSGKHRLGLQYQHANIGNRDQVLTLNYQTALDQPTGVKVDIFSLGYRLPLYALGDSIDFIFADSSTNTPANVLAPGGTLGVNGKGKVFAFRYNHILPRQGEFSSRVVFGLDYKFINATCTNLGVPVVFGTTAACTPYTLRPVSVVYSGQWQKPGEVIDFNLGALYHMFPMGSQWSRPAGMPAGVDHYSFVGSRDTPDRFAAVRFGGSYIRVMPAEWMLRAALSGQYAQTALPAGEQFGMAGSTTVRGFLERAVAADRGYVVNLEAYSPEYGGKLGIDGSLKAVAFIDWASGQNLSVPTGATTHALRSNIASFGIGLRYNLKKDVVAKFDLARVLDGHKTAVNAAEAAKDGDIRGHFSLAIGF